MRSRLRLLSAIAAALFAVLAAALNPIVVGQFAPLGGLLVAYVLILEIAFVAIAALCLLYFRSGRRWLFVLAAVAVALLPVFAAATELALGYARLLVAFSRPGEEVIDLLQPDPRLGWRHIPNTLGRHISPGNFDVLYRIDAAGLKAIDQPGRAARTLHVFGDSFLFGSGVTNEDTALNLLAARIGDRATVRNNAVMSYGLEQMFFALRRELDAIRPGDMVVFAPQSEALERNFILRIQACRVAMDRTTPVGKLPIWREGRWDFVRPIDECGLVEIILAGTPELPLGRFYHARRYRTRADALLENADRLFAQAAKLVQERGARFLLIFAVSADQCASGEFGLELRRLSAPFVTFLPFCPKDPDTVAALRFPSHSRWTPAGNGWAARTLETILEAQVPELR